jgi:hypothetical protein
MQARIGGSNNSHYQFVLYRQRATMPGMGENVEAGQEAIRAELASLNETVRSLARSQVAMQRDKGRRRPMPP